MPQPIYNRPLYILFLVLPAGISFGFASVTLPYLLTQNGFSVAHTANIVALGVSASLWRFLWGPVTDLTLSLRKWYWIGSLTSSVSIILFSVTPFTNREIILLTIIVFISQVAANLVLVPVGDIMANRIERSRRAVILYAIGKKNESTKYALLSSLGNLPVVYMTTFDGWAHDKYNSKHMLVAEALVCILFVVICIFVINQLKMRKLLLLTVD